MSETATGTEAPQKTKGRRKEMVGRVVSNKMQKTVVVAVDKVKHHRLYKRTIRLTKKYYAHDEGDSLQIGDVVRIVETRPLSKLKRWRVAEVVRQGTGAPIEVAVPDSLLQTAVDTATNIAQQAVGAVASAAADVAQNALNPNPPADEAAEEDSAKPRRRSRAKADAEDEEA